MKPFYKSKTMWAGIATVSLGLIEMAQAHLAISPELALGLATVTAGLTALKGRLDVSGMGDIVYIAKPDA